MAVSRLENRNELRETTVVLVASGATAIRIDPFRMLSKQIAMQLFL
jgi:hypothetical protein